MHKIDKKIEKALTILKLIKENEREILKETYLYIHENQCYNHLSSI